MPPSIVAVEYRPSEDNDKLLNALAELRSCIKDVTIVPDEQKMFGVYVMLPDDVDATLYPSYPNMFYFGGEDSGFDIEGT